MINWDPVFEYIIESKLTSWNKDAVAAGVVKAWDVWGEADAKNYIIQEVELYGDLPFRYKIDVVLGNNWPDPEKVIDWKTKTTGKLDERWELRETRSRQKKLYAAALAERYGVEIFPIKYEVRGVVLDEAKPLVKALPSLITAPEAAQAVREIRDIAAQRDTLVERSMSRDVVDWPQDPSGCRLYGDAYKCPHEPMCWEGVRKPANLVELVTKPMSHSKASDFLRCAEYYRLNQLTSRTGDDDEDEVSGPGTVFHKAMEMLYKQAQLVQLTGTQLTTKTS